MSAEKETRITRPSVYPECDTCHIALSTINEVQALTPPIDHISHVVTDISIVCAKENNTEFMKVNFESQTQLVEKGSIIKVSGGDLSAMVVECPHFSK